MEGYRESITALTKCLDTTAIFDGSDLEFTLATEDIQSLVETYNQLKPSGYPGILSSSLGSTGIAATKKLFDDLIKSIVKRDQLRLELSKEPLRNLITSNFGDENLLETNEKIIALKNLLNIIEKASAIKRKYWIVFALKIAYEKRI